jgi:hypothetical protein
MLAAATVAMIIRFCVCDEISRVLAGHKAMFLLSSKCYLQKQLTLCNLKEACLSFEEQNPEKLLVVVYHKSHVTGLGSNPGRLD